MATADSTRSIMLALYGTNFPYRCINISEQSLHSPDDITFNRSVNLNFSKILF